MSSSFEKSVKGGTKVKLAPPKAKYVEHILLATQSGEAGVAEVFRTLQNRLRDATWTVVFKALIIVHMMIKEGQRDVTLRFLAAAPKTRLALNSFTDVQTQGQNIRRYSNYLLQRAESFADTKFDYVQSDAVAHMRSLTIDKGLLREASSVQSQIRMLLKCDFFSFESENEIALMAFRLVTKDLMDLYSAMNQATMNILGRYFELSRPDAERAISIYKVFVKQTDQVVQYLSIARQYEQETRLEIPKIKHAPTGLAASLQEYLDDKDFETNRRQYIAEQQGKQRTNFGETRSDTPKAKEAPAKTAEVRAPEQARPAAAPTKGPAPDLIDFFDSIEQQQEPMAQQPGQQYAPQEVYAQDQGFPQQQHQPTGNPYMQAQQGSNPFVQAHQQQQPPPPPQPQQLQPNFTGAGFGGYGPQPQQDFGQSNGYGGFPQSNPQAQAAMPQQEFGSQQQIQPQSTNPFRQSMMMPTGGSSFAQSPPPLAHPASMPQQQQSTNPFARQGTGQIAASKGPQSPQGSLQPQMTGTNPFARPQRQATAPAATTAERQSPMVTGSTNPFRQSTFVNQQTGQGWQNGPQASMGGWEQMETVPVFPRPGQ